MKWNFVKNISFLKAEGVLNGVSIVLSIICTTILWIWHILNTYSFQIMLGSILFVFAGILINRSKSYKHLSWSFIIFGSIFLITSLFAKHQINTENRKSEELELLSDATFSLIELLDLESDAEGALNPWIIEAIEKRDLVCVLFPIDENPNSIRQEAISELRNNHPPIPGKILNSRILSDIKILNSSIKAEYGLIVFDMKEVRECLKNDDRLIILPTSISDVAIGWLKMKKLEVQSAKCYFEKADSSGNATGTYYLSKWLDTGYDFYPNPDSTKKALALLEKAARNGCRVARLEWGEKTLRDSSSTKIQLSKAEDYLRKAANMNTIATHYTYFNAFKSLHILNEYYRSTKRYKDAYKITEKCYRISQDPSVLYLHHLDNCLSRKKYKEALSIIEKGEKDSVPYCYLIHAGMYTHGQGVKQDFKEAERLLRFAADSLNYYPAYKGLAELYYTSHKKGELFWEYLYAIKFDNRIAE